jgi:hypothetical protein
MDVEVDVEVDVEMDVELDVEVKTHDARISHVLTAGIHTSCCP